MIQGALKTTRDVSGLFLKGMKDGHEGFAGLGSGEGLRAEADFTCDDQRTQVAFREIVFGGDLGGIGPVIEATGIFTEDALVVLDGGMLR